VNLKEAHAFRSLVSDVHAVVSVVLQISPIERVVYERIHV